MIFYVDNNSIPSNRKDCVKQDSVVAAPWPKFYVKGYTLGSKLSSLPRSALLMATISGRPFKMMSPSISQILLKSSFLFSPHDFNYYFSETECRIKTGIVLPHYLSTNYTNGLTNFSELIGNLSANISDKTTDIYEFKSKNIFTMISPESNKISKITLK